MEPHRKCKKCGIVRPIDDFPKHDKGWRHECRPCFRVRHRKWSGNRRDDINAKARADYHERRRNDPEWWQRRLQNRRVIDGSYAKRLRDAAYDAYGGPVCACCGETEVMFLSIDHVNNDGYEHRKTLGPGASIYAWLKRNDYPDGFQILCMNCNFGKHRNGGVCPHKQEGSTTIP